MKITADRVEDVALERHGRLRDMYVLSPFVWRDGEVRRILVRAVPGRDDDPRLKMAEIWQGSSRDGRRFEMHDAPILWPGPDPADLDGCEDPTVLQSEGEYLVWYTGWHQEEMTGRLLFAAGPSVRELEKRGVVLDSTSEFRNPKEATAARGASGEWALFFEYAHEDASVIGRVTADHHHGPWRDRAKFLGARPDSWDSWHVSTGPIVEIAPGRPVMFYNGATRDANWRIGWAELDANLSCIVGRGEDPLVMPPELDEDWTDIAFAASAMWDEGELWLYYSIADRQLKRVRLCID